MKTFILMICLALTGAFTSVLSEKAQAQLSSEDLHHNKSVYFRQDKFFPLGEERSFQLLRKLAESGAQNISIEFVGRTRDVNANEIFYGKQFDGGFVEGLRPFIAGAHLKGLTVTFKLVLKSQDEKSLASSVFTAPTVQNGNQFINAYKPFLRYYAKLAQQLGADELVIGTGLTSVACKFKQEFSELFQFAKSFYKGAVRFDLASPSELKNVSCYQSYLSKISVLGVDLETNATLETVQSLSKNGYLVSRLSFSGEKQIENGRAVLNEITKDTKVSVGVFTPGPFKAEAGESPLDNELMNSVIEWLQR